jgi:ubiquinone/menaquinone biosynthesis C-methylase UbiE
MMQDTSQIFLPGGFKQFRILKSKYILPGKNVLVIGAGSEKIAEKMSEAGAVSVKMIVNDSDSLLSSRLNTDNKSSIVIKMMDFDNTDFDDEEFDLIYSQASVSTVNRNKILKEIKRILKPGGVICVSEMTSLSKTYPVFVKDIFETAGIIPLVNEECNSFYTEKNFTVLYEEDLSSSLKNFYENTAGLLKKNIDNLTENEKSYYKKLLHKISHESNAYLKLGADKFIGLKLLILKKTN